MGDFIDQNMPAWERRQATVDQFVDVFGQAGGGSTYPGVQIAGGERDENIARMLRLANEPGAAGATVRDGLQPDGSFRVTIIGTADSPLPVGADSGGGTAMSAPGYSDGRELGVVTVRDRAMTQAEMDEFDRLHPEVAAELAARQRPQASITAYVPGVWEQVWHSPSVQHALDNSMTGTVLKPLVNAAGTAWASFMRKDGYNFATNRYMNPVERLNGRIDSVINVAAALIPGGGAAGMMRAEMAEAQTLKAAASTRAGIAGSPIKLSELRALREMGLSTSGRRAVVEGFDLGLGLTRTDGQWALRDFAGNQGAKIYYSHGAGDMNMFRAPMPATDEALASNIQFLMERSNAIKFNLNGVVSSADEIPAMAQLGARGLGARVMHRGLEIGNHTNWELSTILANDELFGKTTFFLGGKQLNVVR